MAKIESLSELDEYHKQKEFEKNYSGPRKYLIIAIIIAVSLALGLIVYFVSDALLKKEEPPVNEDFIGEQISLTDENVQILYQYVTYGTEGTRNQKFVNNRQVDITSFSDREKLYYALQFAQVEDFEFTGERNSNKDKIYVLPMKDVMGYMRLFFGPSVTYNEESQMTYPFTFYINKMNVGRMEYNKARDGYDTTFTSSQDLDKKENPVDPSYGQLLHALRKPDGSIVLQERVVYTELRTDNGLYAVNVYKDPEKTELLETIGQLQEGDLDSFNVDFSKYSQTAIVEYTFAFNGQSLYFQSSRIIL